jgi:FAD:protein FMN transferase
VIDAPFHFPFQAMGTACSFHVFAANVAIARRSAMEGAREVYRLEGKYSRYDPESFLSAINAVARRGGEIAVDDETADILDLAFEWHRQSDGLFDITSGVLRQLWHFEMQRLPTPGDVADALNVCGLTKLSWKRPLLAFPIPGMEIDFGGIVKEYACDMAAEVMLRFGARSVLVDLGGDIRVAGERPDGSDWSIGIRRPGVGDEAACVICLGKGGLATSGDYERFFEVGGKRYGHVLDPRTGWPVEGVASVSVVSGSCLDAGRQSTLALLKGREGPAWLARDGADYLVIDEKGAVLGPLLSGIVTRMLV